MTFTKYGQEITSLAALPSKFQSAMDRDANYEKTPNTFPTQIFKGSVSFSQGGGLGIDYQTGGTLASFDPKTGQVIINGLLYANGGINTGTLIATSIIGGTLNNATLGSPTIIGGTATNTVINHGTLGTPVINGGTVTGLITNNGTVSGGVISGGTLSGVTGAGGGMSVIVSAAQLNTVSDNIDYFVGSRYAAVPQTVGGAQRMYIPRSGTVTAVLLYAHVNTPSSAEAGTINLRVNDTTDFLIGDMPFDQNDNVGGTSSLSIPVAFGDFIELKMTTPAFTSNPSQVTMNGVIYLP